MEVRVEVADGALLSDFQSLEKLRALVKHNIKVILQIDAEIKLVEPLSLKRFEGKARRVTDLRQI